MARNEIVVSHNMACRKKSPQLYDNINMVRCNSPWYTRADLIKALKNLKQQKFLDINIKKRTKNVVTHHNYKDLLKLAGKYDVDWVGISNVESPDLYSKLKKIINNPKTKICAKIETLKGCRNAQNIMDTFDGIMVDTEDLAFEIGWPKSAIEKEKVYKLCEKNKVPHFRLAGTIFNYIHPEKVVYTFGVWDLLHPGHIYMLEQAKSYGDKLIVGVVGDKAVEELKGKGKPAQFLKDRLAVVKSLKCVDEAIVQKDYNPEPNLNKINPDIVVKGSDWNYIPGQEWVEKNGKKLIKPDRVGDWSTTSTMKRIKKWFDPKKKKEGREDDNIKRIVKGK